MRYKLYLHFGTHACSCARRSLHHQNDPASPEWRSHDGVRDPTNEKNGARDLDTGKSGTTSPTTHRGEMGSGKASGNSAGNIYCHTTELGPPRFQAPQHAGPLVSESMCQQPPSSITDDRVPAWPSLSPRRPSPCAAVSRRRRRLIDRRPLHWRCDDVVIDLLR